MFYPGRQFCTDKENLAKRMDLENFPSSLDSTIGDTSPLVDPNFQILAGEVYEETSGEKLN